MFCVALLAQPRLPSSQAIRPTTDSSPDKSSLKRKRDNTSVEIITTTAPPKLSKGKERAVVSLPTPSSEDKTKKEKLPIASILEGGKAAWQQE